MRPRSEVPQLPTWVPLGAMSRAFLLPLLAYMGDPYATAPGPTYLDCQIQSLLVRFDISTTLTKRS